jgi:uncharacterized protein (TIGR02217 family)
MTSPYLPTRWLITTADGVDDPDVFPLLIGQSFLVSKKPTWSTAIATSVSGRERRSKQWSYPRWSFKVSYEVLRDAPTTPDLQRLEGFFLLHGGRYQQFFFLDPGDNTVVGQQFGTGDGVTTVFRLTRAMTFGGATFSEPVGGLTGTPTIFVNGAPVAAFTVGPYGVITFTSAPAAAAVLTWTGRFLFTCRFDQDDLDVSQMMTGLWSLSGLQFMSVKA